MKLMLINNAIEFHADSPFNVHIEGAGSVSLYKRTSGEGWNFMSNLKGDVIDEDIQVNIPKDYRIVCSSQPTRMVVTMGGESYEVAIPNEPNEPNVNLITFTISGYQGEDRTFTALEGMTWREFCESEYNTEGWESQSGTWIWLYDEGSGWNLTSYCLLDPSSDKVPIGEDLIKADHQYSTFTEGGIGGGGGSWG